MFRHVCALFCELLREIVNQSLYTSHSITDFVHLWFCKKLEKLSLSPLWRFVKIPTVWRERRNARWEKWLARWFTKCYLYTYRFSHSANIFSHSRQFADKCIAGFTLLRETFLRSFFLHYQSDFFTGDVTNSGLHAVFLLFRFAAFRTRNETCLTT